MADFVGAANRLEGRILQADAPGRYTTEIDGLGSRRVRGPEGLLAGAPVLVVVRPEELTLGAEGFRATVVDVAFLGAQRTVRLHCDPIGDLVATTAGATDAPGRGSELYLDFDDEHAWAVPA